MPSRLALLVCALALAATAPLASAALPAPVLRGFGAWATSGSRVAFVATVNGRSGLWVERFGSNRPARLGPPACAGQEQIDQLAAGPNGSWGCLERTVGNTEAAYVVDVVSSRGVSRRVARAGGPTGPGSPPVDSIPLLVGDGGFLGYLRVTASGTVQLFRIAPGRAGRVADLAGASAPQAAAVAGGTLALLERDGVVAVFTTGGRPLATIRANAASLAVTPSRVVARTRTRRLVVYGVHGGLVHSWRLGAATWSAGLATDGRDALYLGANKAARALRLSNGRDRIVARAGGGFFFDGVALGPAGAVAPLTLGRGVVLRFLTPSALGG